MPSNFVDYAIDFSGDGRPDIWNNVPDMLGSTANYLHKWKWEPGLPWGFEVVVPDGFDYMQAAATSRIGTSSACAAPTASRFRAKGERHPVFSGGAKGPAFIVTENFAVLKEYNNSDAYAIAVGHLADRIARRRADSRRRGRPTTASCRARRASRLQKKLAALGYKVNDFEGHVDFDLRDNIRAEQKKFGMVPDGNPTAALLARLGVKTP